MNNQKQKTITIKFTLFLLWIILIVNKVYAEKLKIIDFSFLDEKSTFQVKSHEP